MSKRIENRIWELAGNLRFKRGSLTINCKVFIIPQRNCKVDELCNRFNFEKLLQQNISEEVSL
jgi:hypothetical protein